MSFLHWMAVLGSLLLILTLASAYLRWLPVTTSTVYLVFGLAIGPLGLGLWQVDFLHIASWMEHLTEVVVLVSLFIGGMKLRLAFRHSAWFSAYLLAGPVMLACILGVTLVCHYGLQLSLGTSLLIGALLAPTDPVLASLVQVSHARDYDRVRYGLSGEAGFNDGVAFPFVIFALLFIEQGESTSGWLLDWTVLRLLWAVPAGLLIGFYLGRSVGRLAIYLRTRHADAAVSPNDFLALALIALSYFIAESLGAWGFLSAFAAGVGLRHAEVAASGRSATPAEEVVPTLPRSSLEDGHAPAGVLIKDILSFGHILERILEVLLVTILGALLALHWDWRAVPLGLALFAVIRPLSVWLLVRVKTVSTQQRHLLGWFGIRGIGSLYYLSYALNHGLAQGAVDDSINLTLSVVAMSIVLHGLTTQPLLDRYERQQSSSDTP
ncbi:sodium:proton antiporter [Pseudomonas taeanensis MS-3]|uniref:Sodium:proton antiporter n=1 Tax=Pseudomonas taeanensis MS-3 TaxID=1395571 RepID=A0A0A1YPJ1_9PSED|nr:sodium:proton antiporter [Pseudomonas taeanensis]KFX70853.1 sodium:proton antiporter [Pseudomonas taeanensis MS-3]